MWHALRLRFNIVKIRVLHQNTPKLWSGNPLRTTWREQAKPNPVWHSGGGFDTRTSTPVPKCNYHTQRQQRMDRENPIRGWCVSDIRQCTRAAGNDPRVPDVEWKSQDANQRRQVEDHGISRNSPAEERPSETNEKGRPNHLPCPIPPAVIVPRQEIRATTVHWWHNTWQLSKHQKNTLVTQ